MAERLHNQISGKTQAGQIGKLIARHFSGSIREPTVVTRGSQYCLVGSRQRRRLFHYFLRQRKAGGGGCWRFRPAGKRPEAQGSVIAALWPSGSGQ